MTHNGKLVHTWEFGFLPTPGCSIQNTIWLYHKILEFFRYLAGGNFPLFSLFIFLGGGIAVFHKKPGLFYFSLLPLLIALLACIFRKYPLEGRLVTYMIPAFFVFTAEGFIFLKKQNRVY